MSHCLQIGQIGVWSQVGCSSGLLDLYAECRLCSRVASPDLRLKTDRKDFDRIKFGRMNLCEMCVQAILDVCLPSKVQFLDSGEECFILKTVQVRAPFLFNLRRCKNQVSNQKNSRPTFYAILCSVLVS